MLGRIALVLLFAALATPSLAQEKLKALFGIAPDWEGDLDEMRRNRFADWS